MCGTTTGPTISRSRMRRPQTRPRTSASAVMVPTDVAPIAATTPALMLNRVAAIQSLPAEASLYERRVNPLGGNGRCSAGENDIGTTITVGIIRNTTTAQATACRVKRPAVMIDLALRSGAQRRVSKGGQHTPEPAAHASR